MQISRSLKYITLSVEMAVMSVKILLKVSGVWNINYHVNVLVVVLIG